MLVELTCQKQLQRSKNRTHDQWLSLIVNAFIARCRNVQTASRSPDLAQLSLPLVARAVVDLPGVVVEDRSGSPPGKVPRFFQADGTTKFA